MQKQWWVANGSTATCMIPPDDVPATPAAAEQMFRADGTFHDVARALLIQGLQQPMRILWSSRGDSEEVGGAGLWVSGGRTATIVFLFARLRATLQSRLRRVLPARTLRLCVRR
jgi:hypothetical protein